MQILFEGGDGATKPEVFYSENDKALIDITPVITNMEDVINPNSFNGFNLKSENTQIDKIEIILNGLISVVDYVTTLNLTLLNNETNTLDITYINSNGTRSKTTKYSFECSVPSYFRFQLGFHENYTAGLSSYINFSPIAFYLNDVRMYIKYLNTSASTPYMLLTTNTSNMPSACSTSKSYEDILNEFNPDTDALFRVYTIAGGLSFNFNALNYPPSDMHYEGVNSKDRDWPARIDIALIKTGSKRHITKISSGVTSYRISNALITIYRAEKADYSDQKVVYTYTGRGSFTYTA